MADPTQSTDLVEFTQPDEIGIARLQRRPVLDRIDQRQLELIKRTLAVSEGPEAITDAEVGYFLELCANYGLDPFAREAWIAKSKTGKLLVMVGRDGVRKIVNRNGLEMRGATIYAKDEFAVDLIDDPAHPAWEAHGCAPFHHVTHKQRGIGEQRGAVVGAWARVWERATGVERGYFDAPLSEYMPVNASQYSPWSKQRSAMMLGAVERQAGRQATPLGGLLVEGEDESARAAMTVGGSSDGEGMGPGWGNLSVDQVREVMNVIERAQGLRHAGLSDRATIQQRLNGQPDAVVAQWVEDAMATLDTIEVPVDELPDAEVIPDPETRIMMLCGEAYEFMAGDPAYDVIETAIAGGPGLMEKAAMALLARGDEDEANGELDSAQRYRELAEALHGEAQA